MFSRFFERYSHFGLRQVIAALVLALMTIMLLITGVSIWNTANSLKQASGDLLEHNADALRRTVEVEMEARAALLRTIADMTRHDPTNATFLDTYSRISVDSDELPLAFAGTDIARVTAQHATTLNGIPVVTIRRALVEDGPVISNLFRTSSLGAWRIAILIAVPSPGGAHRVLGVSLPADGLIHSLAKPHGRNDRILAAVVDGNGRVVGRSRNQSGMIGARVPNWERMTATGLNAGLLTVRSAEGADTMLAYRRLDGPVQRWAVVMGEPQSTFDSRWANPVWLMVLAQILSAVLIMFAAMWLVSQILRPLGALARRGVAMVSDNPGPAVNKALPHSRIREFERLRASLSRAQEVLNERAASAERAKQLISQSELRYRALAEVGTLVFFRIDALTGRYVTTGWLELTGEPEISTGDVQWVQRIHRDDWPTVRHGFETAYQAEKEFELEFRVLTQAESWRWVHGRCVPVRDSKGAISEWVGILGDVDDRRKAQDRIAYLAHHDILTNLHNRSYFQEYGTQLLRDSAAAGQDVALHMFDVNNFKLVNDVAGHAAGDTLLTAIAAAVSAAFPDLTKVRIGGDEFVILQPLTGGRQEADDLARQIVATLAHITLPENMGGTVQVACGYSVFLEDGRDLDQLLRNSDLALYCAKDAPQSSSCAFTPEMAETQERRQALKAALALSLEQGGRDLSVMFQPQIRLDDGAVVCFEALVRWHHPVFGEVVPDVFIPLAEESGLIVGLGRWVLATSCRIAAGWPSTAMIAVNLSPVQVARDDLPEYVAQILAQSGLPAARLELEITEGAFIQDAASALETLQRLKALGVRIAMDDFGTGYSSLAYLHNFPFDKVKIDRTFVKDLPDHRQSLAIIKTVVTLGEALEFEVLAEGVETRAQFEILCAAGCRYGQGFLGEPLSSAEMDHEQAQICVV